MKTEKVEFYKDRTGKHRWKVTGKNGERIASSSEGFERAAGARKNFSLLWSIAMRFMMNQERGQKKPFWYRG